MKLNQVNKRTKIPNKLLSLPIYISILIFLVVCFGCGCGFDYNLSKTLYSSNKALNAIIGGIISNIGIELGLFVVFIALFSLVISSYVYKDKQKWKTVTANILGILAITILNIALCINSNEWQQAFNSKIGGQIFSPIITFLITGGSFCITWFFIRKLNKETVFKVMFWFIIFAIAMNLLRFLICFAWSRPRPKIVFDDTNLIDFKPVWEPNWFKVFSVDKALSKMYQSFPSGHTAVSGICIAFIVSLNKIHMFKSKITPKILLMVSVIIMLMTAFGRMIAGWHFLSDVSFGAIITFSFAIGLSELLTKKIV